VVARNGWRFNLPSTCRSIAGEISGIRERISVVLPEKHQNRFSELSSSGLASSADLSERMTTERLQDDWLTVATVHAIVAAEHRLLLYQRS
jgi:hypothetical protein